MLFSIMLWYHGNWEHKSSADSGIPGIWHLLLIKHSLGMFWSIISSFVQNKNAAICRFILFAEQSNGEAFPPFKLKSCLLLLGPCGSSLHPPHKRVSKWLLHPHAETCTGWEESSAGENSQYRKISMKNKRWDKGMDKIVKGEVEHVMLHDITSQLIPELPVQSGSHSKEVLEHTHPSL